MISVCRLSVFTSLLLSSLATVISPAWSEPNWPAWRGPENCGVAEGNPPTTWSETENIRWKIALPGTGQSTPVVWGDKMFILAAVPVDGDGGFAGTGGGRSGGGMSTGKPKSPYNFEVICLDKNSGEILWRKTATTAKPEEGHHPTGSFAPYSAVTDGEYVWASFGSRGLHCYSVDGEHQWSTPLLPMQTRNNFGEGSSPALAGDAIVVVQDHEGDSRIGVYDKKTGKLLWEKSRDEITAWATPYVVTAGGKTQIITNATNRIRSYDLATGEVLWECGGMTTNVIPTPVVGFGNVYCASGFRGAALTAISLDSKGDVTQSPVWNIDRGTPYVPSPLLYGKRIYFIDGMNPKLSCADAVTGTLHYEQESIEGLGRIYASPVGAGGHVYVPDRDGLVAVLTDDDAFKVVATNTLDDGFDASPVVIGDVLYLKGNKYLYCIAAS